MQRCPKCSQQHLTTTENVVYVEHTVLNLRYTKPLFRQILEQRVSAGIYDDDDDDRLDLCGAFPDIINASPGIRYSWTPHSHTGGDKLQGSCSCWGNKIPYYVLTFFQVTYYVTEKHHRSKTTFTRVCLQCFVFSRRFEIAPSAVDNVLKMISRPQETPDTL